MKKILIIILAGVLLHPLPTKAQFGQDAAALIGFLTPYLGALEALSEASGMEISDLKKITQQSIQLTSSLAKVYNAGNRLYRVSSRTHEIYIEYLETIKYIYDNSIYFEDEEASYHVACNPAHKPHSLKWRDISMMSVNKWTIHMASFVVTTPISYVQSIANNTSWGCTNLMNI